jgi:hypothetical protein
MQGRAQGFRLTLCRCGESAHKPYCDGSHASVKFVASGEAVAVDSMPLAQRDGPLTIDPALDGPLHVTGNLEVVTGMGKNLNRVTESWLCDVGRLTRDDTFNRRWAAVVSGSGMIPIALSRYV